MRSWIVAAFLLVASVESWAQDAEAIERFERTLENIRSKRFESAVGLTLSEYSRALYGAYVTLSGLATDDEDGSTRILRQVDAKLWTQVQVKGHMFYGRLRFRYRDFNSGDAFTSAGDELVDPIGDRYWYRFDWTAEREAEGEGRPDWNWWLQAGRQFVHWVSGLALSESLYAVRAGFDTGPIFVEGFWGTTPRTGTIDFDASRPGYTTDVARNFWGVSVEYRGFASHRPYVYVVRQEDENDQILPGGLRFGYDSTYVAVGSAGQIQTGALLYRVEFIFQSGTSTSDLLGAFPQTLDDISAWAARIMLVWMPSSLQERWRMRFEFEVLLGSGDDDRLSANQTAGGNTAGTDDESFNAFGYVNTGLALAPELANLVSVRLGLSLLPYRNPLLKDLRIGFDVFFIAKYDGDAPLSVNTVPGDSFVGVEFDIVVDWKITSDAAVDLRYGIFAPGDAIVDSSARHFLYLGFSYGF